MITENDLVARGFNKIVWNRTIAEYWLPLLVATGDTIADMNCRLCVRFGEFKGDSEPRVYLIIGSILYLAHISQIGQLLQLYELLTGNPKELGDAVE